MVLLFTIVQRCHSCSSGAFSIPIRYLSGGAADRRLNQHPFFSYLGLKPQVSPNITLRMGTLHWFFAWALFLPFEDLGCDNMDGGS